MSLTLTCDSCKNTRSTGLEHWWELTLPYFPPDPSGHYLTSTDDLPLHFCSDRCLASWSSDRATANDPQPERIWRRPEPVT